MAVEAWSNRNLMNDMEDESDDDAPLVFKRSNTSSRQNQSNSATKKPDNVRSPNGETSNAPKVKSVLSPKPSSTKSPPPSLKASNPSSSKGLSGTKSPPPNLKPSTSSMSKGLSGTKSPPPKASSSKGPSVTKSPPPTLKASTSSMADQKKLSIQGKSEKKPSNESEDSEDEKPLSSRVKVKVPISSTSSQTQKPKVPKHEDSDNENKFRMDIAGSSSSKAQESDDEKPLSLKMKQNGSTMVSNKRPQNDVKSPNQSLIKKPKLSVSDSVKPETKGEDEEDHVPISQRMKKQAISSGKKIASSSSSSVNKVNKYSKKVVKKTNYSSSYKVPPSSGEGQKWTTLEHNGVIFPPPYKPNGVKMNYKGKPVTLTPEQEEVATMYAVMLETEYMNKTQFKENFFNDWKKLLGKNHVIQNLEDCDFRPIYEYHMQEKEKKKLMTTEEKKALKEEKLQLEEKYMWAIVDGVKEKVGNFRVEPPGLFRGRGEHPKMGKLKKRIRPKDIVINIGKDAPIPECPIPGESWKEIRHDNTVTWLAYWNDPINPKEFKYVFLAASSTLKGQSDKEKYEKARLLKDYVEDIRATYTKNFTNKDLMKQQIAVATYLIDKLALRAGNEKDDDEADTVGCCTLKVENVEPIPPNILKFDFLGKDSIRYQNEVPVEDAVFKAIKQFRHAKKDGDDLFDRLDTSKLNSHLKELMPGLTAKVFRTYNASITLDQMLSKETKGGDMAEKIVVYNHANKEVAIICNHQRTVSKSHSAQMTRLNEKIDELKGVLEELQTDLGRAKKGKPPLKTADGKPKRNLNPEALEKKIAQTHAKIEKMERDKLSKEDLKTVALGTSKINYLDPRITVAWCKRHEVPIEKMFNKSLLAKFSWAMDVEPSFRF